MKWWKKIRLFFWVLGDKRTSLLAKILIFLGIGYTLVPLDIIPDVIPIIGELDDIIILPIAIYFAYKLLAPQINKKLEQEEKK